mmetsp:Transcript_34995/g.48701  ORF Transcript_34995/g.48701 Transcript_34995/m.48701 type:complete len:364 (+) Transcript_34995:131-1222(+)
MSIVPLWTQIKRHLIINNDTKLNFKDTVALISFSNLKLSQKEMNEAFEESGRDPKNDGEKLRLKTFFDILIETPATRDQILLDLSECSGESSQKTKKLGLTPSPVSRGLRTEGPLSGDKSVTLEQDFDQGPNTCLASNRSLSASWKNIDSSPDLSNASSDDIPTPRRMIRRAKAMGNAFISPQSSHRSMRLGRAFGSPTSSHRLIGSSNLRVNARRLAKEGRTEEALQKALFEEQRTRLARRVDTDSETLARIKDEKNMLARRNVNLSLRLKRRFTMMEKMLHKVEDQCDSLTRNLTKVSGEKELLEADCMKLKEQFQQVTQMQTETKEKLEKIEKKLLEVLHESASEKTRLGRRRIPKRYIV